MVYAQYIFVYFLFIHRNSAHSSTHLPVQATVYAGYDKKQTPCDRPGDVIQSTGRFLGLPHIW